MATPVKLRLEVRLRPEEEKTPEALAALVADLGYAALGIADKVEHVEAVEIEGYQTPGDWRAGDPLVEDDAHSYRERLAQWLAWNPGEHRMVDVMRAIGVDAKGVYSLVKTSPDLFDTRKEGTHPAAPVWVKLREDLPTPREAIEDELRHAKGAIDYWQRTARRWKKIALSIGTKWRARFAEERSKKTEMSLRLQHSEINAQDLVKQIEQGKAVMAELRYLREIEKVYEEAGVLFHSYLEADNAAKIAATKEAKAGNPRSAFEILVGFESSHLAAQRFATARKAVSEQMKKIHQLRNKKQQMLQNGGS